MTRSSLPRPLSLLLLVCCCCCFCCLQLLSSAAGAQQFTVSSSQSKTFWDQIKANNEQRKADGASGGGGGGGGPSSSSAAAESPSLREVLESKKARRNRECRPDFCYQADAGGGGGGAHQQTAATGRSRAAQQICGTDGKTYESRCMLQFLRRCHGQKVKVRHMGACGAPVMPGPPLQQLPEQQQPQEAAGAGATRQQQLSCQESRLAALSQSSRGEQVIFVPQCRRDGNFRRVQCNYQLKYCFCVRKKSGKPLPGTGVQLPNRPRCKRRRPGGRSGGRRRNDGNSNGESRKQNNQKKQGKKKANKKNGRRSGGGQRRKAGGRKNRCSSRQRAQFNRNILKQFEVEFNASVVTSRGGRGGGGGGGGSGLPIHGVSEKTLRQPERRSAEWKFSELDANSDGQLSYRETKALRKVTRANIKPKNCARRFFSTCDLNSNKRLERAEWILCFGLENSQPLAPAAAAAGAVAAPQVSLDPAAPAAVASAMVAAPATATLPPFGGVGSGGGGSSSSKGSLMELVSRRRKRNRAKKARPFAHKSCPLAREEALAKNRQQQRQRRHQTAGGGVGGGGGRVFVPECSPDGKYVKRQCHSDAGGVGGAEAVAVAAADERLCFCMDPDSGRVLKSRGGVRGEGVGVVDCESAHLRARATASADSRGCAQPLLSQFAGQLTALMVQETRDAWTPQDGHLSVEARSLRLRFQRADVNRDGRLDRKEQRWWRRDLKARWQSALRSSRELRQTRKCATNFLRFCNANRDGFVTLQELQACLGFPAAA